MDCALYADIKKVTPRSGSNVLLENVQIRQEQPGLIWIKGNNGTGKSILASILAGKAFFKGSPFNVDGNVLFRKESGEELIANNDRIPVNYSEHVTYLPQKLGTSLLAIHHQDDFCLAMEGIYPDITGVTTKEKLETASSILQEIFETLNLWAHLKKKYGKSSYGETRRIEFACAISPFPYSNLVVLDEPFLGLDENYQKTIANIIHQYMSRFSSIWIITSHESPGKFGFHPDKTIELEQDDTAFETFQIITQAVENRFNSSIKKDIEPVQLKSVNISMSESLSNIELSNLRANPGEITYLQGKNGSGKTTIAKLLAGLFIKKNSYGDLDGGPYKGKLLKAPNKETKLTLQNPYESFIHSSVKDDLDRPVSPYVLDTDLNKDFYDFVSNGWHDLAHIPSSFSFGQLRFLQTLLIPNCAEVVIFDELLFGINKKLYPNIMKMMNSIAASGRIVISTRQIDEINTHEDNVFTIVKRD